MSTANELKLKIGFVGAGQMAQALACGIVAARLVPESGILASDPVPAALQSFADRVAGSQIVADNGELARQADVLFLSVKPQHISDVLAQVATNIEPKRSLVVSIAAGVTLETLQSGLPEGTRVVRVMPNTPCLIGKGVSAYSLGSAATGDDGQLVCRLLEAVGGAHLVDEKLLAGVTGLSGSGPAFVYTVIEALADGGVAVGLPRALAIDLAARTVSGAGEMVIQTGEHPGVLRDRVTSPGGTTIAGMAMLEQHGARSALIQGVCAATLRAEQLGSQAKNQPKS